MKSFEKWIKENRNGLTLPEGNIGGSWFAKNGFPIIVRCSCCEMTMCIVNAMVDDEGCIFCAECANS